MLPYASAYVIAGRRTAVGRVGGLHRARRLEDLAAQAIGAALKDAKLVASDIEAIVLGNASEGGNPARLAGLAAGLGDTAPAVTIDRQCASGLDAILTAIRLVSLGEAEMVAAGGAESLTHAPWRLARPRSPLHPPRFGETGIGTNRADLEAAEALGAAAGIDRKLQDDYAAAARRAGAAALLSGRLARELAPFGAAAAERRDEPPIQLEKGQELQAFRDDGGTLTMASVGQPGDGAAMVIVAGEAAYRRLGRPPALRLLATAAVGAKPGAEASAPIEAVRAMSRRLAAAETWPVDMAELNETTAIQAIAFARALDLRADQFNATGGAIASGRPFGAASAVLVSRLFAGMLAAGGGRGPWHGLAATGAQGGEGVAALFERAGS